MAAALLAGCGSSSSSSVEVFMSAAEDANIHAPSYLADEVYFSSAGDNDEYTWIGGGTKDREPSLYVGIYICDALEPGVNLPLLNDPSAACLFRDMGNGPYAVVEYDESEGPLNRSWISTGGSFTIKEVTNERVVVEFDVGMAVRDLKGTENSATGTFSLSGTAVAYEDDRQQN